MADNFFDPFSASGEFDRFEQETRTRMQDLMSEIERDFRTFLDQLLQEELGRFEQRLGDALGQSVESTVSSQLVESFAPQNSGSFTPISNGTGSLLSNAFNNALNSAIYSLGRSGRINPRSVFRAGASSIGRVIGNSIGDSITGDSNVRLSRGQSALEALGELTAGRRNG